MGQLSETIKKNYQLWMYYVDTTYLVTKIIKLSTSKVNQTTESKRQYEKSVRFFGQHFYVTVNNNNSSKSDSKIEACEKKSII